MEDNKRKQILTDLAIVLAAGAVLGVFGFMLTISILVGIGAL